MSDSMIKRLDYAQSRFTELRKFGPAGFDVIRERQRKLPSYTSDDLRALQVTLARHLCLALNPHHRTPGLGVAQRHARQRRRCSTDPA